GRAVQRLAARGRLPAAPIPATVRGSIADPWRRIPPRGDAGILPLRIIPLHLQVDCLHVLMPAQVRILFSRCRVLFTISERGTRRAVISANLALPLSLPCEGPTPLSPRHFRCRSDAHSARRASRGLPCTIARTQRHWKPRLHGSRQQRWRRNWRTSPI